MKILRLTLPFTSRFAVIMVWAQGAAAITCMLLLSITLLKFIWGVTPVDVRGPELVYIAAGEQWFFLEIVHSRASNVSVPDTVTGNFLEGYTAYNCHPGYLLSLIYMVSGAWYTIMLALTLLDPATWVIWLRLGRNPLRWLHYASTGPIITSLAALSAGIGSVFELVLLGVAVTASYLFLLVIDVAVFTDSNVNRAYTSAYSLQALRDDILPTNLPRIPVWVDKGNGVVFYVGFISALGLQVVVWMRIIFEALYFQVKTQDTTIPDAIWALVITQVFVVTLQFAILYLAYGSIHIFRPYSEALFLIIDLFAKCCIGGLALQWNIGIRHTHSEQ